jgi:hypothetical protein
VKQEIKRTIRDYHLSCIMNAVEIRFYNKAIMASFKVWILSENLLYSSTILASATCSSALRKAAGSSKTSVPSYTASYTTRQQSW